MINCGSWLRVDQDPHLITAQEAEAQSSADERAFCRPGVGGCCGSLFRVQGKPLFPCPCCGYLVFEERPGSYEICRVCGWEDDVSQLRFPTRSGANAPLIERQRAVANPREWERTTITPEDHGYVRDADWRPLDPDVDDIEEPRPGVDYGSAYAGDYTAYYYWRERPAR